MNNVTNNTLRVLHVEGSPTNKNVYINYQTQDQVAVLTEKPAKLIQELLISSGLSLEDSKMIYHLACEEMQSPDLRIKAINFIDNDTLFEVEDINQPGDTQFISATDIIYTEDLSKKFSAADLKKICYQHTQDEHLNMKRKLQSLKENAAKAAEGTDC